VPKCLRTRCTRASEHLSISASELSDPTSAHPPDTLLCRFPAPFRNHLRCRRQSVSFERSEIRLHMCALEGPESGISNCAACRHSNSGLGGFEVKWRHLGNKFNGPRTTKEFQVIRCQGYVCVHLNFLHIAFLKLKNWGSMLVLGFTEY